MTTSDDVRRVASALPRAYEVEVRGRAKFRVKQIVFVAFSRDERDMGFGFPKAEREGLVAADPGTFYLPGASDLRYQWVCVHLDRLDPDEMRELVVDAWRMCTPQMLHDLPDQPAPTYARCCTRTCASTTVTSRCAGATRCSTTSEDTRRPGRRQRSRSATVRSTAGGADRRS